MTNPPDITVCVPAWNCADVIDETLASLAAQTHRSFKVRVSVDRSDDDSLDRCRRWETDPRFEVIAQRKRRGFPGNIDWLLKRVDTPFLCIMPHDDRVEPDYLERLAAALHANPGAALSFCDILFDSGYLLHRESLLGDAHSRVCRYLLEWRDGLAWRGLIRTDLARQAAPHPDANDGYAADVAWLLQFAALGDFVHVPGLRYHKRTGPRCVTAGWATQPVATIDTWWMEHAAGCLVAALSLDDWTPEQRRRIAAAGLARALTVPSGALAPLSAAGLERAAHLLLRLAELLPPGSPIPDAATPDPELLAWDLSRIASHLRR